VSSNYSNRIDTQHLAGKSKRDKRNYFGSGMSSRGQELDLSKLLPPEATTALPGTEEKMRVMEERLAAGYHPHHPDDAERSEE